MPDIVKKRFIKKGFTLIELLVAAAILVVLASAVIVNFEKSKAKSRDAKRKSDVSAIMDAIVMYNMDHGEYPNTDGYVSTRDMGTTNESLAETLLPGGYIPSIPMDPLAIRGTSDNNNTVFTGYEYYRYDYATLFNAAPTPGDAKRCGIFTSLENPTQEDLSTTNRAGSYENVVANFFADRSVYCNGTTSWGAECVDDGRRINFAIFK